MDAFLLSLCRNANEGRREGGRPRPVISEDDAEAGDAPGRFQVSSSGRQRRKGREEALVMVLFIARFWAAGEDLENLKILLSQNFVTNEKRKAGGRTADPGEC